jgi:hemerythrin superfamily protein
MAAKDIYERLHQDHERHKQLISQIEETSGDSTERRDLFKQLMKDVMGHSSAEEETLYSKLLSISETRQQTQHSTSEHGEVGMMLVELSEADMGASAWLTKFNKLGQEYNHHVEEEEGKMFPAAKKQIDEQTAVRLRDEFNARKPEEVERAVEGKDVPEIKHAIKEEEGSK